MLARSARLFGVRPLTPRLRRAFAASDAQGFDKKCDMWGMGVLLYMMLSGAHSYPPSSHPSALVRVSSAQRRRCNPHRAANDVPVRVWV